MRGLGVVAVRNVHLLEVDVADAQLRFRGFGDVREEGDEVAILLLGLGEGRAAAFLVPGVGDGELGAHHVLRVGIGVEQGLEVEPADVVVAAGNLGDGLVIELLIGQLLVLADQRVELGFLLELGLGVLGRDDAIGLGDLGLLLLDGCVERVAARERDVVGACGVDPAAWSGESPA
jgi:hypothetical protein